MSLLTSFDPFFRDFDRFTEGTLAAAGVRHPADAGGCLPQR